MHPDQPTRFSAHTFDREALHPSCSVNTVLRHVSDTGMSRLMTSTMYPLEKYPIVPAFLCYAKRRGVARLPSE